MTREATAPSTDSLALRASVAFVWLATGLGVLHPFYREVGTRYLQPLGLPDATMVVACVAEVLLGLCVLLLPARPWLAAVQVAPIAGFTLILGIEEPRLLVDPFGVLSKNVSLVAFIVAAWLLQREGWTPRSDWILRAGLGFLWVWEGLLANTIAQSETLREVIQAGPIPLANAGPLLAAAGIGEALGGLGLLFLRGRPLRILLILQTLGLLGICALVTNYQAALWFHPFGPLTKNVPLIVATVVLLRRQNDRPQPALTPRSDRTTSPS